MTMERFILLATSLISAVSVFYMPKNKYRLAFIAFLAFQATTWAVLNYFVEVGTIAFPVREFTKASRADFSQNFIFYPTVFAWFIILYPEKSHFILRVLHYFVFVSIIVWFIYFISIYTDLEEFIKGTRTSQLTRLYINFSSQFVVCHAYVRWFSRKTAHLIGV